MSEGKKTLANIMQQHTHSKLDYASQFDVPMPLSNENEEMQKVIDLLADQRRAIARMMAITLPYTVEGCHTARGVLLCKYGGYSNRLTGWEMVHKANQVLREAL